MIKESWVWVAGGMVLLGLALQAPVVVVLGFAVGLVCGAAMLWARWSLRRVVYERRIREDHAFPGEEIPVVVRLTNRKPLPLLSIETRDAFPDTMVDEAVETQLKPIGLPNVLGFDWRTALGAYERVTKSIQLTAAERGVYELGPATLKSGDPFGLFPSQRDEGKGSRVIVYPRTVDLGEMALPSRRPHGENATGLRVFEDPSRVAGLRDYQSGDPLKRIDWNATARLGKLQSRLYDPSSSQHLLVCLNTQTMIPAWAGYIPELLERSIVVAASVARDAHERHFAVGLLATSSVPDSVAAIRIPPGSRTKQPIRVLEALAVVIPFVLEPLSRVLDREEHRLAVGTTLVIVTATMPEELAITLHRLRRRGHRLVVMSTSGDLWPGELLGIDVRDVSWVTASASPAAVFSAPVEAAP